MAQVALPRTRPVVSVRAAYVAEALALGLILAFALRLRLWNLDAYTGSFDEGIRSQQLFLMSAGYRPFRDIFASQGPLLLDLLFPFYLWFGQTLAAARMGVVVLSMVGLVGTWWVGRLLAGPVAGLAAAAVLALSPTYLENSRMALAEVPTTAPALLAVGAALVYATSGRRGWLLLSATLCALALLIKPMVVHVGAPVLAILLVRAFRVARHPHPSPLPGGEGTSPLSPWEGARVRVVSVTGDLLLYAGVVAALSALVIAALGPTQVWDNLGAYRTGAGHQLGADWSQNLRLTAVVLRNERLGFFALIAVGLLFGLAWRPARVLPVVLWVGAILGMFLLYGDLADKHIVYLVPPLALLAGTGVRMTVDAIRALAQRRPADVILSGAKDLLTVRRSFAPLRMTWKRLWITPRARMTVASAAVLVGLAALGVYLWTIPGVYRADVYLIREAPRVAAQRRDLAAELDMAEVMRTRAGPDEWVLSDNPNAAFRARRPVIPYLVDTSGTRVDAGSLTSELAIEQVGRYRPAVIVTWTRRLGRLRAFTRWLPDNGYRLDRTYDNGWRLYVSSE